MRTKIGFALAFVGAFLLVVGVLMQVYAQDKLMRTPLDIDRVTNLSGKATLAGADGLETFPVKITSVTKADSAASDDDVIVIAMSQCVLRDIDDPPVCVKENDPQKRLLSASESVAAVDRVTSESVNDPDYLPAGEAPAEGLQLKWPFDVEKRDYEYWNSTIQQAAPVVFSGKADVKGHECYVFKLAIKDASIDISDGVKGLYDEDTTYYVDPTTGTVINQVTSSARTTEDGSPVLAIDYSYTDETQQDTVDEVESNVTKLNLITTVVPLVGYILGIPLLLGGLAILWFGMRGGSQPRDRNDADGVSLSKGGGHASV